MHFRKYTSKVSLLYLHKIVYRKVSLQASRHSSVLLNDREEPPLIKENMKKVSKTIWVIFVGICRYHKLELNGKNYSHAEIPMRIAV